MKDRITLAITGASGFQYGLRLLECLLHADKSVNVLVSPAAHAVAAYELDLNLPRQTSKLQQFLSSTLNASQGQLFVYDQFEWTAPIASGSNTTNSMVICPCSSGTLAAIVHGMSNNLIERAADVILKERRKLIVVMRESPLSVIHLENMHKLASLGAVILPASPGFYHRPTTVSQVIDFVVARILDHLDIDQDLLKRWGFDLQ